MKSDEGAKPFIFYSDKLNYKTVEGKKGKEYWVEGYISTGDLDLVNDIATNNCQDSMFNQFDDKTIKLDFEHEAFRGKTELEAEINKTRLPLGKAVEKKRDNTGVHIAWKLNDTWKKFDKDGKVTMTFKELWKNVEEEYYDAFSIAYIPTRTTMIERDGKTIRLLDDVNLLNVALTGNPVNIHASMTAVMMKSLDFMKSQEKKSSEDDSMDLKKIEIKDVNKKSYSEDGKHVHTEEKPMGEHNHPEIEKEIERLWDRIYNLNNELYDLKYAKTNDPEESMALKDTTKTGEIMTDKKDNPEPAADAPATPAPEGQPNDTPADNGAAPAEEKSVDIKALAEAVATLTTEVKDLKKENADLKAIVEKPIHKGKGAESKSNDTETKSLRGPLDVI